jgi:peptide chain release factor 1
MFSKLDEVEKRYEQINNDLQQPDLANDQSRFRGLMKELATLGDVVKTYREYKKTQADLASSQSLLNQETENEMRSMIREEIQILTQKNSVLEGQLKLLMLPKDPNDEKNIILEVRAGAGGDEASLFAEELFSAYCHYASGKGWRVQVLSISPGNVGGYKEAIAAIVGEKVFSSLKYESGVHRVQRVPKTEAAGRIHTSTVTVAVLPEAEEIDVKINPNDLRIDVYRSSGHGGQSVNTTDSAVRVTHLPTGMVVTCQDGKSQLMNKEQALKVLYSRLLAQEEEKAMKEASSQRLAQIGTGDRSERIRTYNFPQSRITDHRIGFTTHQISAVMGGALDTLIEPVITHYQAEALKRQSNHA